MMNNKIGIDIGNVLTERDTDLRPFGKDYLNVAAYQGAFEAVTKLAKWFGSANMFLVSKCSLRNQELSRDWLVQKEFFALTDIPSENLYFCEKRVQKRSIAKAHQLNYFIDDRWSVLRHLENLDSIKKLFLFNPFLEERDQFEREYNGEKIIVVESWPQILENFVHEG